LIAPEVIEAATAAMIASAPGPIHEEQVLEDFANEDWPGK
jgi:hypothetical protein